MGFMAVNEANSKNRFLNITFRHHTHVLTQIPYTNWSKFIYTIILSHTHINWTIYI